MTTYETREIWTNGRRSGIACVTATIYPHSIVTTADSDHITEYQMERALGREFPRHTFHFNGHGGRHTLRADADRWTNDGISE